MSVLMCSVELQNTFSYSVKRVKRDAVASNVVVKLSPASC